MKENIIRINSPGINYAILYPKNGFGIGKSRHNVATLTQAQQNCNKAAEQKAR